MSKNAKPSAWYETYDPARYEAPTVEQFYTQMARTLADKYASAQKLRLYRTSFDVPVLTNGKPLYVCRWRNNYDKEPISRDEQGWPTYALETNGDRLIKKVSVARWHLEVEGTGSSYRPNRTFAIPDEVGQALDKVWKKADNYRYVGFKSAKTILKLLEGYGIEGGQSAADLIARGKAAQEAENARRAAQARDYDRKNVATRARALVEEMTKAEEGVLPAGTTEAVALMLAGLCQLDAPENLEFKPAPAEQK